jgi:hypothetical protein
MATNKKPLISDETFQLICDHLAASSDSLKKVLDRHDVSPYAFYQAVRSAPEKTSRYMLARSKYVENKLSERVEILEDAQKRMGRNPKIANAIAQIAKEKCRIIEWDCIKLLPRIYGEKLDVTSGDESLTREITIISMDTSKKQ